MKPLREEAILRCAGNEETRKNLREIFKWRERVFERNEFSADESRFALSLCGLTLSFKVSNAFSAIETFQEIFIENNHCEHPAFLPDKAACVLDIGANQGFYSLRMKAANPSCAIIAYEPNPFEFESLQLNFAANAIASDIVAENLAVFGDAGKLKIEVIPQIGPIGGVALRTPRRKWLKEEFVRAIQVNAVTLDDVLFRHGLEKVDILKLDVEGAEIEILRDFRAFDAIDKAVIEYHTAEGRAELLKIMAINGFQLVLESCNGDDYFGDAYFMKDGKSYAKR